MFSLKVASLVTLCVATMWATTAAQGCTGYLPGNCLFEAGEGYMMCNAGSFCSDFGVPANNCASGDVCTRMCDAAASYGGTCITSNIPWVLSCGDVVVLRREITIPGMGVVNCDEQIQVQAAGMVCSISRGC